MSLAEWTFLLFLVVVALALVAVIVYCLLRLRAITAPRHRGVRRG